MVTEVVSHLNLKAPLKTQAKVIDATLGGGGYTIEFCKRWVKVLGIDQDKLMLEKARKRLEIACPLAKLVHGNFVNIKNIAFLNGFEKVNGIVFDLGVATQQLVSSSRGLSFRNPKADLDMRLDPSSQDVKALDLLNVLGKGELVRLFERTCSYIETQRLVKNILERRKVKPFEKVGDLLEAIAGVFSPKMDIDPATKPFLALRMAVNSELENLELALKDSVDLLLPKGRLVVVSFHSGEEAIVKHIFSDFEDRGLGKVLTKKPILPSNLEVKANKRSRSARLRAFEKK
jgi:16S rRNA (cytosine1402-N4)-methyltransferase